MFVLSTGAELPYVILFQYICNSPQIHLNILVHIGAMLMEK